MRTTITIDRDLLAKAQAYTGLTDVSAIVDEALRAPCNAKQRGGLRASAAVSRTLKALAVVGRKGLKIWTRDKRLHKVAEELGVNAVLRH